VLITNEEEEEKPAKEIEIDSSTSALAGEFKEDTKAVPPQPRVMVYIDSHQNKHQHPKSKIHFDIAYTGKSGSQFRQGKDLAWHKVNTAKTMKNWALGLDRKGQLVEGGKPMSLEKVELDDGVIYDATAQKAGGVITVVYHCNPPKTE
jgi:hypothetical protein